MFLNTESQAPLPRFWFICFSVGPGNLYKLPTELMGATGVEYTFRNL